MSIASTRFFLLLASLPFLLQPLSAQTDVGRIVGTVSDATGAVVAGATIRIKNERTGDERTVTSTANGTYLVPQLLPATYTVVGSIAGFSDATYTNVALQVGQERTVTIVMQAAAVTTEVTVSGGELANVDTDSARMGINVTAREVTELPLNGRQISQLYLLAPGAVNSGGGNFDQIRFSGRANQQNAIRFDGVEGTSIVDASPGNLNGETSSSFRLQSSLENVQEFRIESNSYPAEYGTGTGGQVSIVTKSGSNALRGSLFEYLRNDALDARNFFANAKPPLRLNQFGGSIGGPIVPNRAFFFLSYEGLRQRQNVVFTEATPSAAARARAVPGIRPLLNAFPIGQRPSSDPNFDIVSLTGPRTVDENAGGARFDFQLSDKFNMYVRYFRDQGDSYQTQNSSLSAYTVTAVPQNGVVNLQQIWSPTVINETKIGFNGSKTRTTALPPPLSSGVDLTGITVNITGQTALGGIGGQAGASGVVIPTGLVRASSATNGRGQPYTNYTLSFIDNLSMVRGNHSLKFGVEVRPIRIYTDRLGGTTYTFANLDAFLGNQVSQVQYLGDLSALSPFTGVTGNRHGKQEYYIGYAQDEWKIRPNLTLNYGLRYEYYSVMREAQNGIIKFNIVTGQLDPRTTEFYESSPSNFGPRLALTWSPQRFNNRTVFRVGSGIYYGPGQTEDLIQPIESDRISRTLSNVAYPIDPATVAAGYDPNSPTLGFQPRAYAPGYRVPERILSYTASIQQELPFGTIATVAYVGSQGRNLFLRSWSNQIIAVNPTPTATGGSQTTRQFGGRFAEIDYKTSGGRDSYNSLQTTLNRRFSRGLSLGAQWTYSHSIGNTSGSNEARTSHNPFDFNADYGDNNFDVRHTANLSALYELPYGRGQKYGANANGFADAVLGGWQLGSIVNARTGLPIEVAISRPDIVFRENATGRFLSAIPAAAVQAGQAQTNYTAVINTPGGGFSRNVRRPDLVLGVDPYIQNGDRLYINPAAFSVPQPGTYGNLARNALRGPNLKQLDLTLSKKFRFTETANLEFRSEFYNILNLTNFASPPATLTPTLNTTLQPGQPLSAATAGSGFGVLNQTVSNEIGLGTNRQIQLALRFNF